MDEAIEAELANMADTDPPAPAQVLDIRTFREPIRRLLPRTPLTLPPDATLADAVGMMRDRHVGCVLVVESERLTGILTERDLLNKVEVPDLARAVRDFMTPDPDVLRLDDPILYALNLMSVGGYRHVPLVDAQQRPVGIISVTHIVHYIVAFFPKEVLTLPPDPTRAEEWLQRDGA